jgi:hypothetical protein
MLAPGDCSPSLNVVSNILIIFALAISHLRIGCKIKKASALVRDEGFGFAVPP